MFTARGRVRTVFNSYLLAVDRWDRLAQRIGIDRKSKRVESFAAAITNANRTGDE
jgi:hypothetical protein